MVTIKDIARETGYSFKTVSRALNGEKGVSENTSRLILEKSESLGYVANTLAGSLKSGKTGLIGILTGQLGLGIKSSKLYAIQRELERSGKKSLLSCTDLEPEKLRETLPPLMSLVDGVIVLQPPNSASLNALLKGYGKPILLVDGYSRDLPSLTIDRERGVLEALSQLHSSYDTFLYLNSLPGRKEDGRYKGFVKFTSGLDPAKGSHIIPIEGFTFEEGYHLAIGMGNLDRGRTLILCTNDQIAMGVMKAFYERNIPVPARAGIIGFDGDAYGPYIYRSLATVKQPVDELGKMTVEIMENLLRGTARRREFSLTTRFVPGESV